MLHELHGLVGRMTDNSCEACTRTNSCSATVMQFWMGRRRTSRSSSSSSSRHMYCYYDTCTLRFYLVVVLVIFITFVFITFDTIWPQLFSEGKPFNNCRGQVLLTEETPLRRAG